MWAVSRRGDVSVVRKRTSARTVVECAGNEVCRRLQRLPYAPLPRDFGAAHRPGLFGRAEPFFVPLKPLEIGRVVRIERFWMAQRFAAVDASWLHSAI